MATRLICGPLLILPHSESLGIPPSGKGYIATRPNFGSLFILAPALKRSGPPRRKGLCGRPAHLWATSDFAPPSDALGTP